MNIEEIISKMDIKDKIKLLTGRDYWSTHETSDVKSIRMSDGPNGLRKQEQSDSFLGLTNSNQAICYPTACLSACSFSTELLEELGKSIGKEARSQGVDLLLGPGLNIKRSPLGGRNFEYFSEDPLLSGLMAGSFVKGLQSEGVGACIKHYACNNQEKERFLSNSLVDDRTLNELYLHAFDVAIKTGNPDAIMTSYNMVNSNYMCENKELLAKARDFGFKGMFVTDWGGLNNPIKAFKNGLNIEMPGKDSARCKQIYKAYKQGLITLEEIDNAIKPLITFANKEKKESIFDISLGEEVALKVAEESIVLLKNDSNILPIDKKSKITVIGSLAKNPRIQGAGSSKINPYSVDSFISVLEDNKDDYNYIESFTEALNIVTKEDKLIVFLGLNDTDESEGFDKDNLNLPKEQLEFMSKMTKVNKNIIVVLQTGSPVLLPFIKDIKGLLTTYLAGDRSGLATYNVVFGKTNPSGRLAETWPLKLEDTPTYGNFPGLNRTALYKESLYVGYKYYNALNKEVLFPFGYGLSYSNFTYSNIKLTKNKVSLTVKNNGTSGSDVVEVYLENKGELNYRRLVAFKKISLEANQETNITIDLSDEIYQMYDNDSYVNTSGEFYLQLGKSSLDIILEEKITITEGVTYKIPSLENTRINDLGVSGVITLNSTFNDLSNKRLGRLIIKFMNKKKEKLLLENQEVAKMLETTINEMPLRSISMGTNGKFNSLKVQGLIDILNGHYFKGIKGLFK